MEENIAKPENVTVWLVKYVLLVILIEKNLLLQRKHKMKILGIGNAIVDVLCKVDEEFLNKNLLTKSTMKLIDENEFQQLLSNLKIEETISGGSIANSIVGTNNPHEVYKKYLEFLVGMKKELALYNKASKILYKKQRMSYWMLKLFFGKKFMNGYSEGKTLTEIIKGKYPFPST